MVRARRLKVIGATTFPEDLVIEGEWVCLIPPWAVYLQKKYTHDSLYR
jgi:hypothetical protein